MMSILKLINTVRDRGINCTFYPIFFESLVSRARNAAVAHFMEDPDSTHLLFIDSDIIFEPEDVFKLLDADKPVIAGIYPKKYITWDRLKNNPDAERVDFPVGGEIKMTEDNFIELDYLPTGFLMIKKWVIKSLMSEDPELKDDYIIREIYLPTDTESDVKIIYPIPRYTTSPELNDLVQEITEKIKKDPTNAFKQQWERLVREIKLRKIQEI
jgi:choline kinase